MTGWGLDQELVYLIRDGLKLRPDVVVLFLNRPQTERYSTQIIEKGYSVDQLRTSIALFDPQTGKPTPLGSVLRPLFDPLFAHSYFLSALGYRLHLWKYQRPPYEQVESLRSRGSADPVLRRTRDLLGRFVKLGREQRFELVVVNIDPSDPLSYVGEVAGLRYYDLSEELRRESSKYRLRFLYDGHFNERANAHIGNRVVTLLGWDSSFSVASGPSRL